MKNFILEIETEYAPATVANMKAAIKKALKTGVYDARITAAIDATFKEIKTAKPDKVVHIEEILSDEEIEKLIEDCPDWLGHIIKILALTGMRISELTGIKMTDCTKEGKNLYISIIGKGKKQRRIFIPYTFYTEIVKTFRGKIFLFETTRGNGYSRKFLWKMINDIGCLSIDRDIHPHLFRHTFATKHIKKRGSVKAVSLYLGHASTATTENMYNHDELKPEDIY
ncbi:MAG: tyrosine-type recombinase/integrase [Deltaproteobacteria bacterium]|nr:tyrosine-type recombinase/integrase [Deltaproteobacteria bacterium]